MNVDTKNKERKPLLALTAALVMPGLGHIYNGLVTEGISIYLIVAFMVPIFSWIAVHGPTMTLSILVFLGVLLTFGLYVWSAVSAFKEAKRIGINFRATPINTSYSYIAIAFFSWFFVFGQLADYTRTNIVAAYKVPTQSMIPGIMPGEHFFVDRRVNQPGSGMKLKRGDIVVFVDPNDRTQYYVKRVIGLPGDKVEISGHVVTVNGKGLTSTTESLNNANLAKDQFKIYDETSDEHSYDIVLKKDAAETDSVSVQVPNGQAFLLGDNRTNSMDSRNFGCVPLVDIVGRAEQIWLSSQLRRVGHVL